MTLGRLVPPACDVRWRFATRAATTPRRLGKCCHVPSGPRPGEDASHCPSLTGIGCFIVCGRACGSRILGFFLKEISAIVRATCPEAGSPRKSPQQHNTQTPPSSLDTPCRPRSRSYFAPEPASRTRPRRTHTPAAGRRWPPCPVCLTCQIHFGGTTRKAAGETRYLRWKTKKPRRYGGIRR